MKDTYKVFVTGYGWISERPGFDRSGRRLLGAETSGDWGFMPTPDKAAKLTIGWMKRARAYYAKLDRSVSVSPAIALDSTELSVLTKVAASKSEGVFGSGSILDGLASRGLIIRCRGGGYQVTPFGECNLP